MALDLQKEFILLQAFEQNTNLSTTFLTSYKSEAFHLKDLGLLSGQPKCGADGIAYWNDAGITPRGQKAFRHLKAYQFLQGMSGQAWKNTMSLDRDQLKIFQFLQRKNLITFFGKITPTMGGENIANFGQAEITDNGLDLLGLVDVEDIEDFFNNSQNSSDSRVMININGNGNLNGINQIGGNENSQSNSAPVENHIDINQAQHDSLQDLSNFIKEMSSDDAKQLKIILQSIKDGGSWNSDINQEKSFLEQRPRLKKAVDVLLDIVKESGKAAVTSYISQHFPMIFGFLMGL
ncbi:MAG: hypothetical protein ABF643_04200 [Oenococcus oeni]